MKRKKISSDILLPDSELVKKDIETAIKRNIDRMSSLEADLKQVHAKIIKTLDINSTSDCVYFDFFKFKEMFMSIKNSKKEPPVVKPIA